MKKLLALLLALMMVFALAACGENTEKPSNDNPGVSQSGENNDSQGDENNDGSGENSEFGFPLKEETLAKMESLGVTEENKRVLSRSVLSSSKSVQIIVYSWTDPDGMYDGYQSYYFFSDASSFDKQKSNYDQGKYTIVEENQDELWILFEMKNGIEEQSYGMRSYTDIYNYVKYGTGKDLVE